MAQNCRKSCKLCNPAEDKVPRAKVDKLPTEDMQELLDGLKKKLVEAGTWAQVAQYAGEGYGVQEGGAVGGGKKKVSLRGAGGHMVVLEGGKDKAGQVRGTMVPWLGYKEFAGQRYHGFIAFVKVMSHIRPVYSLWHMSVMKWRSICGLSVDL